MRAPLALAATAVALLVAAPASAATSCTEPGEGSSGWQRATPAAVGMDAAKLQDAIDYATTQLTFATRIYRHGCLVAADRTYANTSEAWYESWSMAKSVTSLVFGRAMTMGLVSPDDPVGSLIPEADAAHGKITLRNLLTQTSGLHWNGLRDYDIAMEDRLRDFLTVGIDHPAGTWFEYSQTGPFTLAEAISRAAGEDFQAFAQRELFTPLGIRPQTWKWVRDGKGRTQGFMGVNMRPDDFGRLGDLMRRGGVWKGKRLLSRAYVRDALTPSKTNGCYGWLIWVNKARPCISPTVSERPVNDRRNFPGLPEDLYRFSGLFGQLVSVFPTQDIVVVRTGSDPDLVNFSGGAGWEDTLYRKVLGAITDGAVPVSGDAPEVPGDSGQPNPDNGFQYSLAAPDQAAAPFADEPIPAAGPFRQRALILRAARMGGRHIRVRVLCPKVAARPCTGTARMSSARKALAYSIAPGAYRSLRFTLRRRHPSYRVVAVNADDAGGARSAETFRP
ncbi:MAG: serine hydrolase domain-containing protein [Solirubrobacteraceae bacterium]